MGVVQNGRCFPRGSSIATVLILAALGLTLALTLAGMSFSHMSVSTKLSNGAHARALAEAAIAKGLEQLSVSEGKAFLEAPFQVEVSMPHLEGGVGRLTFDPDQSESWGLPASTHNLKNDESVLGSTGRVVPRKSVHFVAEGLYRGSNYRMEAVIHVPTYKYPLSSEGPLQSDGPLFVASVDSFEEAVSSDPDYQPGDIVSNSPLSDAILLNGSEIEVTGTAQAVGEVVVVNDAKVKDAKPNSEAVDLPEIDLADFDPVKFGIPEGVDKSDSVPLANQTLDGIHRHSGDLAIESLRFPDGKNRGALLWVDGDVTISSDFTGTGALFATGDITINNAGQVNLDAGNNMAVVAGGNLAIHGRGGTPESAFFSGVIISGGDAEISGVTVAGTVTSGKTRHNNTPLGSDQPKVTLTGADLIHVPDEVAFEFRYPFMGGLGGGTLGITDLNVPLQAEVNIQGRDGTGGGGDEMLIAHFYNPETDDFEVDWNRWDGFLPYDYDEATHSFSGSPFGYKKRGGQFATDAADLEQYLRDAVDPVAGEVVEYRGQSYETWDEFFQGQTDFSGFDDLIAEMRKSFLFGSALRPELGLDNDLERARDWYRNHYGQPQQNGTFTLDPNQFVQWDGRMKVLFWREL